MSSRIEQGSSDSNELTILENLKKRIFNEVSELRALPKGETRVLLFFCAWPTLHHSLEPSGEDVWESEIEAWNENQNEWFLSRKYANKIFREISQFCNREFQDIYSRQSPTLFCSPYFSDGRDCFYGFCDFHFGEDPNNKYPEPDSITVLELNHEGDFISHGASFVSVQMYGDDYDDQGDREILMNREGDGYYATGIKLDDSSQTSMKWDPQEISSFLLFKSKKMRNRHCR